MREREERERERGCEGGRRTLRKESKKKREINNSNT